MARKGNGFEVLRSGGLAIAWERQRGPLTGVVLSVRSGSRFDGHEPGIAHLAEHMLFQGTRGTDYQELNRRAAEIGGDHDASTGFEDLNLTFQVRNDDLPEAIALLAEQVRESTVPEDRLENERDVVAQEIRGHREDAITYLCDESWARFFAGGLASPPGGTLRSVSAISAPRLRRFLRERLCSSNMVLSIVGDVGGDRVRKLVAEEFRGLPAGRPQRANGFQPGRDGTVRFRRTGLSQLYCTQLFTVPCEPRSMVALSMALDVLGTDPDGRLYLEVRERLGLSYDLWAELQYGAGWATLQVGAVAPRRSEKRLRRAIADVFRKAADEGFDDAEVSRARRKSRYRYARLADARLDRAMAHASNLLYGAVSLAEAERWVESVRRDEIETAWRRAISGRSLTAVLTG